MMLLDPHERDRFAAYARQQATDSKKIIEQMQKIGIPQNVINKRIAVAYAYATVADDLGEIEDEAINLRERK